MISIWNLEKRKLQTVVKDAHDGPVVALHFLAREPVLLSSGADNSLKVSFAGGWHGREDFVTTLKQLSSLLIHKVFLSSSNWRQS